MMEKELPEGWEYTTIEEINLRKSKSIDPGAKPNTTFELYSVPIFDTKMPEIVQGAEIKSSKQIVEEGEVLICKINPRINRVWIVGNFSNHQKIASSEWIVINTEKIISPEFLMYQFSAPFFRSILQSEVSGVGGSLTRARPKLVENYPIYLCPLAEQNRIVAKLDMAFGYLETLKASLARIPELLKTFRQSILTQAVTGKLTEDWREGKTYLPRHLAKPSRDFPSFSIPEEWTWDYCKNLGEHKLGKMLDAAKNTGEHCYYLRNINVRWFKFDLSDLSQMKISHGEKEKFNVKNGDLFICEGGEPGRAAVWQEGPNNLIFQKALHRIRFNENITPNWFLYNLKVSADNGQLKDYFTGTGIMHLTLKSLSNFPTPVPNIEEQDEIVTRVEALFAKADAIEAQYLSLKEKIDKFPQALLAKAFRGELVPQDPDDEPASVLLKKIQASTKNKKVNENQKSLDFRV